VRLPVYLAVTTSFVVDGGRSQEAQRLNTGLFDDDIGRPFALEPDMPVGVIVPGDPAIDETDRVAIFVFVRTGHAGDRYGYRGT